MNMYMYGIFIKMLLETLFCFHKKRHVLNGNDEKKCMNGKSKSVVKFLSF